MEKICIYCKKSKTFEHFNKNKNYKDGRSNECVECHKARNKRFYQETYYKVARQRSVDLKEKLNAYSIKWNREHKERVRKKRLIRDKENVEKRREYMRYLYRTSPQHKMKSILRSRLMTVLKSNGIKKTMKTMDLLGCDINYFKKYIESKFLPNMKWENHGKGIGKWSVDHIIPCASFDLTKPEEQKKCFHYSNMMPVWDIDNAIKSSWHNGKYYRNMF